MPKTASEDQEHIEKAARFPSGEAKWSIVCPSLLPCTSCKWPLESSWQIINNLPDVPSCRTFVLIWLSAVIPCEKTWCEPLWVYPKHTLQGPDCCSSVSMIPIEWNRQNSKPVVMKWNSFHFIKRENRSDLSAGLDGFLRSLPTGFILWFHNKKQVHISFSSFHAQFALSLQRQHGKLWTIWEDGYIPLCEPCVQVWVHIPDLRRKTGLKWRAVDNSVCTEHLRHSQLWLHNEPVMVSLSKLLSFQPYLLWEETGEIP